MIYTVHCNCNVCGMIIQVQSVIPNLDDCPDVTCEDCKSGGATIPFDDVTSYDNRHVLPRAAGVYIVATGATVLYVGTSKNIRNRCANHPKIKAIRREHRGEIYIYWQSAPHNRFDVERRQIARFSPPYNKEVI